MKLEQPCGPLTGELVAHQTAGDELIMEAEANGDRIAATIYDPNGKRSVTITCDAYPFLRAALRILTATGEDPRDPFGVILQNYDLPTAEEQIPESLADDGSLAV